MKLKRLRLPEFKGIKTILINRFGEILLILILILVSLLSFKEGFFLLSNDNYSPELNPTLSVSRYIESPAWRSYRVLGFASESEQADVFRSVLFTIFETLIPKWDIAQVFSLLTLVVGTLSMGYLVTYFVRDFVSTKFSNYIFLISSIFYLTTLWTAWVFNFNIMPYVTQFGFLPLLLLSIYMILKEFKLSTILFYLVSILLFTSSFVIATVFFVNVVFILLFTMYIGFLHKSKIKKIAIYLAIFLFTQIFWLLPFLHYTFSTSQDLVNSYTNRAITANTIDLEADMMNIGNSARFYTRLLGTVDDPAVESFIFPMSEDFQAYDIYKVVGLLPILLSVMGLVFVVIYKKWEFLPIWFLLFGLLFLIKNQNPPLGGIYLWLQENIPLFKQVFRWVSSKLSQAYLITLVVTSTISFFYFVEFLSSFFNERARKLFVVIPTIFFVVLPLFYSEYMFKGQLFTPRALVELPYQYYSLQSQLTSDFKSRIFYAPPANNGYFREYEWGFVGSQFLAYILPNPMMDMSLAIGSDVGERAMLELTNDFNSGNLEELNKDLIKYDIKYILVDRSLVKGRYGYELDWDLVNKYIESWEKVWSQDFLELYALKESSNNKYIESYGKNDVLDNNYFVRKSPQEPIFSPLNLDLSDAYVQDSYLIKDIEYGGVNTILYSNYKEIDILTLPTHVRKSGAEIMTSPALPTVKGLGNNSYKKFPLPNQDNYLYLIGEDVFSNVELERGVNLYNGWDSIKTILISPTTSFTKLNLTQAYSKTKPGDCSGGSYKILPDVTPQETASGFILAGNSALPCLYTDIKLDKRLRYVGEIYLNWESNNDTLIGYCLHSSKNKGCLNDEKYLYTNEGFGNARLHIPKVINGGDSLSLVLYALNPKGAKASLLIRNVEFRYSAQLIPINEQQRYVDNREKSLSLDNGENLSIKIPILSNGPSYAYSPSLKGNYIWQPTVAEDRSLTYGVMVDNGQKQTVQNQYINQYKELFKTNPLKKYLWYWSGGNLANIPASVCLTYVGDDKCMVDSTMYDDMFASEARIFSPLTKKDTRMDASFNSISFHNETENRLQDFIVMEIPSQWFNFKFQPIFPKQYTEVEAKAMGKSASSVFYTLSKKERKSIETIVSIPQAKSDAWVAIGFTNFFFKFLPDSSRVYLDGWKQGWDISGMNNINRIYIFYWPNLLSYLGYISLLTTFPLVICYLTKRRAKYGKK